MGFIDKVVYQPKLRMSVPFMGICWAIGLTFVND